MDISPVFFYIFGGLAIAFSLLVIIKKSLIASAFSLVVVFFSFGAIYALLDAHLVAALQVLVYAGAIMVLFIFVIMLLNADVQSVKSTRASLFFVVFAVLGSLLTLGLFVWSFRRVTTSLPPGPFTTEAVANAGGNTQVVSELLFSEYILPFELTSVLLLTAIVGAVVLVKRHRRSAKNAAS